ncbi:MAG: hypothetical protein KA765_18065, partial [Thermoflexales bacterium]|nr:hypothetical protein [Thermoflexales bacterium]
NSTISSNDAASGGGIYNYSFDTTLGTVTVQNSIVAQQTSGVDCLNQGGGSITSQGYSIESTTSCGFTNGVNGNQQNVTSGALNLQALANNGSQPHPFTHALGTDSVAIDKIPIDNGLNNTGCGTTITTDERGAQRAGGTTHGGDLCDVGAYEVSDQTPLAVTLNDLTATANTSPGLIGAVGAALAALGAWVIRQRRVAARQRLNH